MKNQSVTFSLDIGFFDSCHEDDAGEVLETPLLGVYYSADDAASDRIGLEIVEGDLWFFACDGSPLGADFSKEPHFNDNNTFFPGTYSLKRGAGSDGLVRSLAKLVDQNRSPHTQIIVWIATCDETGNRFGWSNIQVMAEGVTRALQVLPPDMLRRVVFATLPHFDKLYPSISDALAGKSSEATYL
jgi:hypothetical protein